MRFFTVFSVLAAAVSAAPIVLDVSEAGLAQPAHGPVPPPKVPIQNNSAGVNSTGRVVYNEANGTNTTVVVPSKPKTPAKRSPANVQLHLPVPRYVNGTNSSGVAKIARAPVSVPIAPSNHTLVPGNRTTNETQSLPHAKTPVL